MIGLLLIGAPAWWLMHSRGLRQWWACAALGAVLNGGTLLALYALSGAADPWMMGGIFAAIGTLVGAVIWRIAYVRVAPDYLGVW